MYGSRNTRKVDKRHPKKGGMKTRAMHKKSAKKAKNRSTAKRSYRKRVKASNCRGLKTAKCRHRPGCKMSHGKKRSFCRKSRNTKHNKK